MKPKRSNFNFLMRLMAVLFAVMLAVEVWGQPLEEVTINYIEAAAAPDDFANEVRAYVTVSATGQQPIIDLKASNFSAIQDGQAVSLRQVARSADSMAIVLVIDTSGSMQARDKSGQTSMEAARQAAADFIAMLSADDRVALFSFNREPRLHFDFSADHNALISAVKGLKAQANAYTCLYDTLFEAVKKSAEIPRGRKAVILLTDGKDERGDGPCSTHHINDVIDLATTQTIRVPIYTIGVGPQVDPKELGRLAHLTGGRSLLATGPDQLKGFYQTLADQLKNQYRLTYHSQAPSGEHSLVVKVQHQGSLRQDEKRFWAPPLPVIQPPTIRFADMMPSEQSAGILRVKVNIVPEKTVAKLRYYVNGALKSEITAPPFDVFDWNTSELTPGIHVLRAEVIDIKGQTGMTEMTREVAAASIPAGTPPDSGTKKSSSSGMLMVQLAGWFALALAAAGGVWWFRRRQKGAEALQPVTLRTESLAPHTKISPDLEDETIFWGTPPESGEKGDGAAAIKFPPATLTVVKDQNLEAGKTFELTGPTSIGRSDDNDIAIPDKAISRKHAEIYFSTGRFFIRDLGSKYGTKVAGRDVTGQEPLPNGVQIQLGPRTILEFHISMQSESDDRIQTKSNVPDPNEKTLVADPD